MTIIELYEMLNKNQSDYLKSRDGKYLKEKSQYFTPISIVEKMLDTIDINMIKYNKEVRILEPAAGAGMLIFGIIFFILENTNVNKIYIDAYELDKGLYLVLKKNIELMLNYIQTKYNVKIISNLYNENFILKNSYLWDKDIKAEKYDLIISNPPYKKVNKRAEESIRLKDIAYGQPNLYSLFMALSIKMLKEDGIYVVLSPRNYLSGMYNEKLRAYIFSESRITHIHSFYNRNFFKNANQEVIISTFIKNKSNENLIILYNGEQKCNVQLDEILYDKTKKSIIVPKSYEDIRLYNRMNKLKTMREIGLDISVGQVVQFREKFISKDIYSEDLAPLIVAKDIFNNNISYYERENKRKTHNKSISVESKNIIKNSNYVLLQKIMAKDDINSIVLAVLEKEYFKHEYLGIDNNIVYFHKINKGDIMTKDECYGVFCYINSYIFQKYYLLINSTHTINISDFENIRFPSLDILRKMGRAIRKKKNRSKLICTEILLKYCKEIDI